MLRTYHSMRPWQTVLVVISNIARVNTQLEPQPLSVPPSEYWDGNDGSWSTFHLNVGTPAQLVRLLPGTSATAGDSIWAVLPEGCYLANPAMDESFCENSRGNVFNRNQSTTWSTSRLANDGLYELDTIEEQKLGLNGNAYYGFETISFLGAQATLTNHPVAGIATNDFWLGSLGLSPLPINFTSLDAPIPSLLGQLRNTSMVPSTSWAYTAGARYKEPPVFGSLTFGGYDALRIQGSGLSLPFWTDQSRDLLVGVQSITYDTLGSTPLMATGVYAFIDSIVTHMWLPLEVCQAFEQAFGLVWDESSELYLLNDTTHARLQAQNPTFTFTLGRVFLQEAYLIADYDRKNFTIGQAAFPSTSPQDLKSILPPRSSIESKDDTLSAGAIAGIAVGTVVAVSLIAVITYFFWRRKRRNQGLYKTATAEEGKAEQSAFLDKYQGKENTQEADSGRVYEAYGSASFIKPSELPVTQVFRRSELPDGRRAQSRMATATYELPGEGIAAAEMEAAKPEESTPSTFQHSISS